MSKIELGSGEKSPVVDFTGFTCGDLALRKATATSMREAFEDFGFIYLKDHSVPQRVVDELFAQSIAFFDLPKTSKAEAGGYRRAGLSGLDPTKPTDVKERFRAPYDSNLPPGYWPERLPRFRKAISVFHEAGLAVLRQLLRGVALSLGIPEEYFDAAHQPHSGAVMLLHYPPITEQLLPGQLRSGAHTDFGTMTLLFHYGSTEGLEIQRPNNTWLHAPSVPGAAIVNVGDLLTRWTNGQLRSVLHRVVPPEGKAAQCPRYSATLNRGMRLSLAAWNPVTAQINLRSIHRSQLVNVSKRGAGKTCAVGMKTKGIKRRTQEMFRLSRSFLVRVVLLSCCVSPLAQHLGHEALAQERIRIGISFLSPSFLPTIVAEKKGFYAKYGLASEHVLISLSVAMSALGTGDLDYACSVVQGVTAAIKGIPLKLVMITQKNLVFALVVRPEVQKVADLKGKTIGISYLGSTMHLVADAIFRHHGLVPGKDVNLFSAGDNQGRLVALEAGRVDASFGDPPFNIWADKRGYKVLAWAHDYITLPQTSILVTDKKIQQSRDQVKRVIKGTIEGLRFIQQRREESIDILGQWSKVDRETAKGMFESFFPAYSSDGTMTDEILKAALEDALKRAKIEKSIPINQIADRTILAEAQKELGIK